MRHIHATRLRVAAVSALALLCSAGFVRAQFAPPTCVPPNCNPEVIQNIAVTGAAQSASINISGAAKLGGKFETGAQTPTFTAATDYLYYGNVNAASTAGFLMLLQTGGADRFKVSLTGQTQTPSGTVAAPSYTFATDPDTGMYNQGANILSFASGGVARMSMSSGGIYIPNGQLTMNTAGTAAAPSYSFNTDGNTGMYRSAADTLNFATNGVSRLQIDSTGAVTIPGNLTVNGTFTSTGGLGGDGGSITNINASNITSGTLNDARLSTNVTTYSGGGTFTGVNSFTNASNSFTGNGAGLTSLNATNISSGTLNDARLSTNVALLNRASQTFTGNNTFTGMTALGGPNLVAGAGQNMLYGVADSTSAGNLMLLQSENAGVYTDRFRVSITGAVTAASYAGSGSGLTALNASQLTSGTVPSARLSGTYANNLTFSGMTSLGSAALNVGAGQNLLYGNVDGASVGSLLLLQNESVDRFRVDSAGNLTLAGTITASGTLTSGGQNVCLQDGSNCPPTLNGAGTADYITKFTGTGDTVGNSIIYEDSLNGRIGLGTTTPNQLLSLYNGSLSVSFGSISAYVVANGSVGVSGQAVGTGSYGVVGSGGSYGVYGTAGSGTGVYGTSTGTGNGVYGNNSGTGNGVLGISTSGWGGRFSSLSVTGGTLFTGGVTLSSSSMLSLGTAAADFGGGNGQMFYNTATNKFRCFENGVWTNCIASPNVWSTINASAGTDPVPDSAADTLNVTGGTAITVTGDATTDTLTIANAGVTSAVAGAGIGVSGATGAVTFTNTGDANAADDLTGLTAGAGISIGGAAPNLTVTNTGDANAADDVTGSGTANRVAKFTAAQVLGDSIITDTGASVGIGNAAPAYALDVTGDAHFTGTIGANATANAAYGIQAVGSSAGGYFTNAASPGSEYAYSGFHSGSAGYGTYSQSSNSANSTNYGGRFAGWYGTGTNYGVYGYGYGGTTAYGVYATSGGATNNWALYAAAGRSYFNSSVTIGSTSCSIAQLCIAGNSAQYGIYVSGALTSYGIYSSMNTIGATSNDYAFSGITYASANGAAFTGTTSSTIARIAYADGSGNRWGLYTNGSAWIQSDLGVGTQPARGFHVLKNYSYGTTGVMRVERSNDGEMVEWADSGAEVGNIYKSGSTISYNSFTGSHYAWTDGDYERGRIVSMTGRNTSLIAGDDTSETVYGVTETTKANDPKVLGAFLTGQDRDEDTGEATPALVMAVGNGDMWVVDAGEDIEVGDYLISSAARGHAMKDPGTYETAYVIARAGKAVRWDDVKATFGGRKHAKIDVFFESFQLRRDDGERVDDLLERIEALEAELRKSRP